MATEKHYDSDWAKSKSRDLVGGTIQDTLLTFRKPQDLRVLCLPGRDAIEIYEIYDPLGIPRENIVGVEMRKDYVKELEAKNLGIQIVPTTLEAYIAGQNSFNFDIVSLDYTGVLNHKQTGLLSKISKLQNRNHFILHCANSVRRDQKSLNHYMSGYSSLGASDDLGNSQHSVLSRLGDIFNHVVDGKISSEEKGEAYTVAILSSLYGVTKDVLDRLIGYLGSSYDQTIETLKGGLAQNPELDEGWKIPENLASPTVYIGAHPVIISLIHDQIFNTFRKGFERSGIKNRDQQELLFLALRDAEKGKFFVHRKTVKYSYISESGCPMIGDVHFLSYPERCARVAEDIRRYVRFENNQVSITNPSKVLKFAYKYYEEHSKLEIANEGERHFLGSSAKPVLTHARAIEEFKAGATVGEVKTKYRAIGKKPLSQWKSWVTRGKYGEPIKRQDNIVEYEEDSDLEKITEEEAVELLQSGIPPEEIYPAWPTSYTIEQLYSFTIKDRGASSEDLNEKVRDLLTSGVPKREIWETYGHLFKSKQSFGSTLAWASPKLAKRRRVS